MVCNSGCRITSRVRGRLVKMPFLDAKGPPTCELPGLSLVKCLAFRNQPKVFAPMENAPARQMKSMDMPSKPERSTLALSVCQFEIVEAD